MSSPCPRFCNLQSPIINNHTSHPAKAHRPDFSPLIQVDSSHADRSSSSEHLCAPTAPARFGYQHRPPTDESRNCGVVNQAQRSFQTSLRSPKTCWRAAGRKSSDLSVHVLALKSPVVRSHPVSRNWQITHRAVQIHMARCLTDRATYVTPLAENVLASGRT